MRTYMAVVAGAGLQVATVAVGATAEVLLAIVAGEIVLVLAVVGVLRREGVKVADARSLERDSPLGVHRGDAHAHEPMREMMMERIDARFAEMRDELVALRRDTIHPMTEAMKEMASTTRRAVDETARTVDLLAAQRAADKRLRVR